jgi:hypothetical protein
MVVRNTVDIYGVHVAMATITTGFVWLVVNKKEIFVLQPGATLDR